jgi:hypothetical protein
MLKNGGFEVGPFPGALWGGGVLVPPIMEDAHSPLPGWMVMSDTKVVKFVDAAHHAVPHGGYAVELVAGRETARAVAGGGHGARASVQAVLLRRGRAQRLRGVPRGGRVRVTGEDDGVVRVPGHGQAQARRARVHGGRQRHPRGVPELEPPHDIPGVAVRSRHRRHLALSCLHRTPGHGVRRLLM